MADTPTSPDPAAPPGVEVSLTDLRNGIGKVLDAVGAHIGQTVILTAGAYWVLPTPAVYDTSRVPDGATATVGSLLDDAGELRRLRLHGDEDPVVWHDLAHIIGLLQRLAAQDLPDRTGHEP